MPLFALEYRFPEQSEARLAVRPRHRTYLSELERRGKVVLAGPWSDDSGALILYKADSEGEVRSLLADDPYVLDEVFGELTLREWYPIVGSVEACGW